MAQTFELELITPEKILFKGEVESVLLPGSEGDFVVLPRHAPLLTYVRPGLMVIKEKGQNAKKSFIRGGFVEVLGGKLLILGDQVTPAESFDLASLMKEIKELEECLTEIIQDTTRQIYEEKLRQLKDLKESVLVHTSH